MLKAKSRAFTFIELVLVVSVIIILTAIGTSSYIKSKTRAIEKEGIANIKLIAAAERIYRMEQDTYIYCTCTTAADCIDISGKIPGCNAVLKLMLNTTNWNYGVTVASGVATITATMLPTSTGCSYTLTSDNFDSEPSPSGCI